jgi:tetratricopeptide (TPR) repeat protein
MRTGLVIGIIVSGSLVSIGCISEKKNSPEVPVVIFRDSEGRTLTFEDLKGVSGTFRYEIVGSGYVPVEAERLHQLGRAAGGRGEYSISIDLLTQASQLAPLWPYPIYDRAYTYLLMHDFKLAMYDYEKTMELSPRGFFTAITALDILTREQKGEFPPGIYMAYLSLEWQSDPAKKLSSVRKLVDQFPGFAPGWKELAALTDRDTERIEAIEKGLLAKPDPETRGMLLINKALVLDRQGQHREAVELLGRLALDPQATYGSAHLAKATLAMMARP